MTKGSRNPSVHVTPRNGGPDGWATKTGGAARADSIHPTQKAAEQRAHEIQINRGGGEVITHNRDGQIRSKDTIGKADPFPPRDKEH